MIIAHESPSQCLFPAARHLSALHCAMDASRSLGMLDGPLLGLRCQEFRAITLGGALGALQMVSFRPPSLKAYESAGPAVRVLIRVIQN